VAWGLGEQEEAEVKCSDENRLYMRLEFVQVGGVADLKTHVAQFIDSLRRIYNAG